MNFPYLFKIMERLEGQWTKQDYQLLLLTSLIKFGDGVELYLPGVITQLVSALDALSIIIQVLMYSEAKKTWH